MSLSGGYKCVVGADEAGRGPLCGPVVAGACFIPQSIDIHKAGLADINDSKRLKKADRERLYDVLVQHPKIKWSTGIVSAAVIDRINILQSSMRAMHEAVASLSCKPDYVLIDGPRSPWGHERAVRPNGTVREADPPMPASVTTCEPVVKGDAKVFCIAAASIIAKVTRDRIMDDLDEKYPGYGLAQHAGYPTRDHVASIHRMGGVCPEHRMTFKPIRGSAWQILPQFLRKGKNKKTTKKLTAAAQKKSTTRRRNNSKKS
jgi:ribonuclease HII